MRIAHFLAPLACAAVLTACGSMSMPMSHPAPARVADGVFVGPNGMTLYTFDRDTMGAGKSVCNGACATNWPPLMAGAGSMSSGDWTVVMRDDGSHQWAYRGKPVYYWAKDTKAGDRTGDNVNNVWHLARP
jgi:predicted lipoprotein with Yx(FWY)xxD motif